jgi:hypothetical protein
MILPTNPDELEHAGVKGMKWGRRKPKIYGPSATPTMNYSNMAQRRAGINGRQQKSAERIDTALKVYGKAYKLNEIKNSKKVAVGKKVVKGLNTASNLTYLF